MISFRKALPIWGDAEGELAAGAVEDVFEVDVDALGGLGPEVDFGGGVFDGAHEGLEHEVELAGVGEFALAVGAVFGGEVVGAESLVAGAALDEGVGEAAEMTAGLPGFGVHEDGGVEGDGIVAELEHGPPPGVFDVALELGAEGAVVPGGVKAAVDFAALEEEAASLGEGEDFFHCYVGLSCGQGASREVDFGYESIKRGFGCKGDGCEGGGFVDSGGRVA